MALVPWKYNNPRINRATLPHQDFIFQGHCLRVVQDTKAEIDITQNTGLKLWDGAYILARYLENSPSFPCSYWKGKRCIELGAGCGLVGMVASLLGAHVVLTDLPDTLDHTRKTLDENRKRLRCSGDSSLQLLDNVCVKELKWGTSCSHLYPPCDVILGSDIIYHIDTLQLLAKTLQDLSSATSVILIAYKARGLGEHVFFDILSEFSLQLKNTHDIANCPDFEMSPYKIIELCKTK